jgi:DNA-binding transcriptional LysR family regulator
MDMLRAMRIFAAVADAHGLSEAGRKLGLSPPAVTRIIADLEAHLGVRLLTRTTRVIRLTDAGARFLDDSRRILVAVTEAEDGAHGLHDEPRGLVSITASVLFGRLFVTDLVIEFLRRFPGTQVSTLFVDRVVHLAEEGLDVAVRIGPLPDSSLRAIRVGTVRRVVCAAPAYLEGRGLPSKPEDLDAHELIGVTSLDAGLDWKFASAQGPVARRVNPRLFVNAHDVSVAAAEAGFGLTQALSYQVAPQLRDGRLQIVLSDHEPPPLPVHVIHREGNRSSARVRALVDHLVDRLRATPAINQAEVINLSLP